MPSFNKGDHVSIAGYGTVHVYSDEWERGFGRWVEYLCGRLASPDKVSVSSRPVTCKRCLDRMPGGKFGPAAPPLTHSRPLPYNGGASLLNNKYTGSIGSEEVAAKVSPTPKVSPTSTSTPTPSPVAKKPKVDPKSTPYYTLPLEVVTRELWITRKDLGTLKKKDEQLIAVFTEKSADLYKSSKGEPLTIGPYTVTRTPGSSRRVDPQMLLDHGVSPAVIAACTVTSNYFQYKASCKGAEADAGEEG